MVDEDQELAKDPDVVEAATATRARLQSAVAEEEVAEEKEGTMSKDDQVKAMLAELAELRAELGKKAARRVIVVGGRRQYRLLKDDVTWCETPQVHALVGILKTFMRVGGDPVSEAVILQKVIENEHLLNTKQGGKKIFDYYKGNSEKGLVAHGNLERL